MRALIFLVDTLLSLALLVTLLRLLLQWVRADFRNPLARAILQLTNPLVLPLRRILPPIGSLDTATALVLVLIAAIQAAAGYVLSGLGPPPLLLWGEMTVLDILRGVLHTYFFVILLYALLSLIAPGTYSPAQALLTSLAEPVLRPVRRLIPPLGGIDFSPLWVLIIIQALLILVN
ncbi:MAG: YggT family protein [Steroidobacteraceae bacterium]|jgi:YggT family protein